MDAEYREFTEEEYRDFMRLDDSKPPRCRHCKFWEAFDAPYLRQRMKNGKVIDAETVHQSGACHRYPPVFEPEQDGNSLYQHPETQHFDWCGELKLRDEYRQD